MNKQPEIIDFLVNNSIYPMMSKKGKIFLRSSRKVILSSEETEKIITALNIESEEDCKKIREEIRERVSAKRINRPIKEWIKDERPRELLVKKGAKSLPLSKLLAIILRTGKEGVSAEELAKRLLNHFGSLRAIDSASISEICKIEGIGPAKAAQIKAAFEIGKLLYEEKAEKKRQIKKAEDVLSYVAECYGPYLRDERKEFFNVIFLDIKNKPIDRIEISKGSIDATVVDLKEIIKEATIRSASSIILVHNHPSGDTEPSPEDIELTSRICEACKIVGIKVLDHIIIGKNQEDYYSFAKQGLLK